MADLSFDVVSKVNRQEVQNALLQAKREIGTRFDFKGTETTIEQSGDAVESAQRLGPVSAPPRLPCVGVQ